MIDLANARVETPYATEARGKSDLAHRQSCFVDELLCKMQTARLSHSHRRCPQVSQEQAAKMPRSYSQTLCKNFYSTVIQTTLADQA
jgi:hypothetical protein